MRENSPKQPGRRADGATVRQHLGVLVPVAVALAFMGCTRISTRLRAAQRDYSTQAASFEKEYQALVDGTAQLEKRWGAFTYELTDDQALKRKKADDLKNRTSVEQFWNSLDEKQKEELQQLLQLSADLQGSRVRLQAQAVALQAKANEIEQLEIKRQHGREMAAAMAGVIQQQVQYFQQQQQVNAASMQRQQMINELGSINMQLQGIRHGY